jgi:hypothetical protein
MLIVRRSIDTYANDAAKQHSTVGVPWDSDKIGRGIVEMETALVSPYWIDAEVRDTFDQTKMTEGPRRRCAVVADDGQGTLLLFDPLADDFVLAQRSDSTITTFGVRGDAVGCFLAR